MYCSLSMTLNMREMPLGMQKSWTHFVCVCFSVCGQQKHEYLQSELHGWRCHYTGSIGVIGSQDLLSISVVRTENKNVRTLVCDKFFSRGSLVGQHDGCESFARSCPTFNPKFIVVEKLLVEPLTTSLWDTMPTNEFKRVSSNCFEIKCHKHLLKWQK